MKSTRRQLEERITAYLLGDLDPDEAEEVRRLLESEEACRALAEELKLTLQLLRDALAADPAIATVLTPERKRMVRAALRAPGSFAHWVDHHARPLAAASVIALTSAVLALLLWPRSRTGEIAERTGSFEVTIGREERLDLEPVADPEGMTMGAARREPDPGTIMSELRIADDPAEDLTAEQPVEPSSPDYDALKSNGYAATKLSSMPAFQEAAAPWKRRARDQAIGMTSAAEFGEAVIHASPLSPADERSDHRTAKSSRALREDSDAPNPATASRSKETAAGQDAGSRIRFPMVQFTNAPLREALRFLETASAQYDPRSAGVQITWEGRDQDSTAAPAMVRRSGEEAPSRGLFSLSLRDITLDEALRALTGQAGLNYRYDGDRVIIAPPMSP